MKHVVGVIYLATAPMGFCWSTFLTLTGLYGLPFSRWYAVVFVGAVLLLIGAIFWWASNSEWTRWVPLIGSILLGSYFIPAGIVLIRQGRMDLIRVLILILVWVWLVVAIKERHVTKYPQVPRR